MNHLPLYLIYLFSGLITVPFISTYIVYKVSQGIHNHQWRAIHQAVTYTNLLYIIASYIIVQLLFDYSSVWIIIVLHLFTLTIIAIYQWKKHTDINMFHGLRILWRISFLIFFTSYLVLIVFGIIKYVWIV